MRYTFPYGSKIADRPRVEPGDYWNDLFIIEPASISKNGRAYFKCRCICGQMKTAMEQSIRNGRTRSCGCAIKRAAAARKVDAERQALHGLAARYRYHAKRRSLEFSLSVDQFAKLVAAPCHYCGVLPGAFNHFYKAGKSIGGLVYSGIDRRDNTSGYTVQNCVPCCKQCNTAKGSLTETQFLDWVKSVNKHHEQ